LNYIIKYSNSWIKYKLKIEKLAKGRCTLTNKNWIKLKKMHHTNFIEEQKAKGIDHVKLEFVIKHYPNKDHNVYYR
jgi:hypothetical protein